MIYFLLSLFIFFFYGRRWIYGFKYFKRAIKNKIYKDLDGFVFMAVTETGFFLSVASTMLRYIYYPEVDLIYVPIIIGLAFVIRWFLYEFF